MDRRRINRAMDITRASLPTVEGLTGHPGTTDAIPAARRAISGAMSLQRGDSGRGNESVPQEFVRLVGCRDPKARLEAWVRPIPTKR